MKQYDTYKDSGIAWIGEIPSEWEVGLIGKYFDEINKPNTNQEETNTLQFKMGEIISKKDGDSKYNPETIEAYNVVEPGTIMINGLNLSFDLVSQRVAQVHERGAITSTYLALSPVNGMESDYAKYLLKAYDNNKALHAMGRGLRATLSYGKFRTEPVLVPNSIDQHSIATFLDTKCVEIDALISLQEEMISELQAYKQSVITEAVTKGLNPHAKMKDSGVEWIGEIPEGWKVCSLKSIYDITDGTHDTPKYIDKTEDSFPLVTSRCIENGIINYELANHIGKSDYEEISKRSYVSIYDVIMPMIGTVGNPAVVLSDKKIAIKNVALFRTYGDYYKAKYLFYYLNSKLTLNQFDMNNRGGVQNFVSQDMIKRLLIVYPNNFKSIATYLDEKTSQIDSLISLKQEKIQELKDYKKSIIYEYVTGKKRV